jgi:hypothetical protein
MTISRASWAMAVSLKVVMVPFLPPKP